MLNITKNRIDERFDAKPYRSFRETVKAKFAHRPARWLALMLLVVGAFSLLPWTQNVRGRGKVTALLPEQRPQTLNSTIAGRIERWYVSEGQKVRRGDTLVFLSEVKDEYFDPSLVDRTSTRVDAKGKAIDAYGNKVGSLRQGIAALRQAMVLKTQQQDAKIRQLRFKITADSMDVQAAETALSIAQRQFDAQEQLFQEGIKSLTELEEKRQKLREGQAKYTSAQNKLLSSRQELLAARSERENIRADYTEKISKSESELFSTLSMMAQSEEEKVKLESQLKSYELRNSMYYVTAPQDGYIVQAKKSGIGEIIKEGETILEIMPERIRMAAEIYVAPMDLPLVSPGKKVRLQFDGWPAVVFSGWPGVSTGTYGGVVYSVDRSISPNGRYRILVQEDDEEEPWPHGLYVGAGVQGMVLLKNVPLWYEVWRQFNGFPPEYYNLNTEDEKVEKPSLKLKN